VSEGGADLYLSGDIMQAAAEGHLAKIRPGRTVAVVDRRLTPTAAMLQSDLAPPDLPSLEQAIAERTGKERVAFLDSQRIAEGVFADHLLANVVLLGAAFQLGGLPVSLGDIERAMRGRAADANREAFAWGRWAVHDPAAVEAALQDAGTGDGGGAGNINDPSSRALERAAGLVGRRDLPAELRDLLTRRAAQAVDYQDARRAERFLDLVQRTAAHDGADHGWALTTAVAEAWFKLLTYKDEYEVARLHLKSDYDRIARDLGIEGPYSVSYQLQPPFLTRLGRTKKLPLGLTAEIGFRGLRRMRRLRGTPFDFFGWDRHRRVERALIEEYERLVGEVVLADAGPPYETRLAVARSVMSIKGYAEIKDEAVLAWRERVAELTGREPAAAEPQA
jgi:indolepyruvate ferredoxin oxidoreductase